MPEPGEDETVRVVALDRSFHVECYKCEVNFDHIFFLHPIFVGKMHVFNNFCLDFVSGFW